MITNAHRRSFTHIFLLAVLLLVILLPTSKVQAYKILPNSILYPKLPGAATSLYIFYEHLNSTLGILASGVPSVHAINQWNAASYYSVFDVLSAGPISQSTNTIRATDFSLGYITTCGNLSGLGSGTRGYTCPVDRNIFLNSNSGYKWNTTGNMSSFFDPACSCTRNNVDYLTIVLHELGHFWILAHPTPTTPVMNFTNTAKQTLDEDDKRGATQVYGPNTGWETALALPWFSGYTYSEAQGNQSVVLYQSNVSSAQLIPVATELGVTPYSGSRHLKFYGLAQANYSYAYMKLFTADNDQDGSNIRHLTITNGMKLSWYQYSYSQTKMSVDIIFSDGTSLRSSGLKDQNGVRVHPAHRGGYSTGVWRYFEVNLSTLAGKRVTNLAVAYDNGNVGPTGIFRAYFDNLQISY